MKKDKEEYFDIDKEYKAWFGEGISTHAKLHKPVSINVRQRKALRSDLQNVSNKSYNSTKNWFI